MFNLIPPAASALPTICSLAAGEVVPIPTSPFKYISAAEKSPPISGVVVLELAITNLLDSVSWPVLLPASWPINILPVPVVFAYPAWYPRAVLFPSLSAGAVLYNL